MDYYSWLVIIITLTLSAFFSGIEIAFITANKLRIELKKTQGNFIARLVGKYVKEPSRFISTTLVCNNFVIVIYGIYMGMVIEGAMRDLLPEAYQNEALILFTQIIISTVVVLIFAEFLPKVIFRANSDRMLFALALPFRVFYFIFLPVTRFAEWAAIGMIKFFTKAPLPKQGNYSFTKIDLDQYVSESANMDLDEGTDVDAEMFKNALDFDKLKARDCMLPRTDVIGIEVNDDIEVLYQLFISSGHSRILLYQDTIDTIIGYAHQVDMFKQPKLIKDILIPIIMVTESTPASDLLKRFTAERKSIALVLDEFGGTAGIVTLEDILEEIIGDIDDEHDVEELLEKKISDTEFEFSARFEIDYLNETYHLNIPEGEYETLGGFIIVHHGDIPAAGEKLTFEGFKITILKQESARIEEVLLKVI